MLQVDNHTPFSAALSVFPDAAGVETAYAVVKATFAFGAEGPVLAKQQLPLLATDVFWGDPGASSLRAAGEFGLLKTATDVLLSGRAVAPTADTRVAEVSLAVGSVRRRLRIFGERHWQRAGGGWKPSLPEPWQRVPLRWELAFGGFLPAQGDAPAEVELRNPVGRGLLAAKGEPHPGQPLPQIEDPEQLIQDPHDRPTPAGLGPVAPTWLPRRAFAGTYDEAWQRGRAPYLPLDFDARFFQVAPQPLVAPGFLQGGEPVHLQGFSAGGPITFTLPRCELLLAFDFDGAHLERTPQLETVLLEPDAGRLQLLFRAALAVDKKLLRLGRVQVHSRAFDRSGQPHAPLARLGRLPAAYEASA